MSKTFNLSVIEQELEKVWKLAQTPSDYVDIMKREIIERSLQRIIDTAYEVM